MIKIIAMIPQIIAAADQVSDRFDCTCASLKFPVATALFTYRSEKVNSVKSGFGGVCVL